MLFSETILCEKYILYKKLIKNNLLIHNNNPVRMNETKTDDLDKFIKCDVFTPDNISKIMANKLLNNGALLEPSVGTGNLLKYINIENYNSIDVYELKNEYLKDISDERIHKYNADFLRTPIIKKYKNIILNPPYIRVQDLSVEYRSFIKANFKILKTGLVDIYYAFILKCIDLLENDGIMVSITPNTYLYNKSSLPLRKYLIDNRYIKEIIDFGSEKVFSNVSVYCCITVFTKENPESIIYNNKTIQYNAIDKNDYNIFNTTTVMGSDIGSDAEPETRTIHKTLKDICKITNGIATLRDKIYIHDTKLYDEPCWKEITNSKEIKYVIYPYNDGKIMKEPEFKQFNPQTYNYLLQNKEELAKRDKGHKTYPEWYAYGRTQSLLIPNKKRVIYIPCFINPDDIKMNINKTMLFYGCLCIQPNHDNDIETIKDAILTNSELLKSMSSKRSGGWINLSSSNVYKLPFAN